MSSTRTLVALGVVLLAGMACNALAQDSGPAASGSMGRAHMTHMSSAEHDAMFMRHAAADGLAEVQLGRIALERASSAQVKQLAQRIVDDHTKANDQLMGIAARKQVTLPTEPMPMQKREADHLKTLSGSAFDRAYAQAMVKDHRKAVKMFGMESQNATDSDLKQFASSTLPVLKTHLQMAEQASASSRQHHTNTPMEGSGSMSMPASGSSTR